MIRVTQELAKEHIPFTECLKDTVERFLPCWHEVIVPTIRSGKKVIIAAHGNSLRALVKYLDNISDKEIVELNIPTGIPLVYDLEDNLAHRRLNPFGARGSGVRQRFASH